MCKKKQTVGSSAVSMCVFRSFLLFIFPLRVVCRWTFASLFLSFVLVFRSSIFHPLSIWKPEWDVWVEMEMVTNIKTYKYCFTTYKFLPSAINNREVFAENWVEMAGQKKWSIILIVYRWNFSLFSWYFFFVFFARLYLLFCGFGIIIKCTYFMFLNNNYFIRDYLLLVVF